MKRLVMRDGVIKAETAVTTTEESIDALVKAAQFARSVLAANPMELSERMAIKKLDAALVGMITQKAKRR